MGPPAGSLPAVGTLVADRYRLERVLGLGSLGTVWLAHDTALDCRCTVKLADAEKAGDPKVRAWLQREAKAAARIRCVNVVDVFDHGEWNGLPFMAMEALDGEDLHSRLCRLGQLDTHATYAIVVGVARALARAHAAGIVHRDIKPDNIFLVADDDVEVVKVLNFGSPADSHTPYYMSPEQLRGAVVDWRSDLWSLAVVAFQCSTGRLPFESEALGQLIGSILYEQIPAPTQYNPVLPAAVDRWWAKAAARHCEDRYQTAKELADAFGDAIDALRMPCPTLPLHSLGVGRHTPLLYSADLGDVLACTKPESARGVDREQPPSRRKRALLDLISRHRKVFLSYRRSDSQHISDRIADYLRSKLGASNVFQDVDNMPLGVDFRQHVRSLLDDCTVCVVVIGREWLEARSDATTRRLDDQRDNVRIEIEVAFAQGLQVIPVLVDGAVMPKEEQLPQSLQKLSFLHAGRARPNPDFKDDMKRLVKTIRSAR
jgi:serine/threonine-protein kinase